MEADKIKCGRTYRIGRGPGDECDALLIYENKTICVASWLGRKAFRQAVFHELAHALIRQKKIRLGRDAIVEKCCDLAAELADTILRDNPGLQKKWYGKEK